MNSLHETCPHCDDTVRELHRYFPEDTVVAFFRCTACDKWVKGEKNLSTYQLTKLAKEDLEIVMNTLELLDLKNRTKG